MQVLRKRGNQVIAGGVEGGTPELEYREAKHGNSEHLFVESRNRDLKHLQNTLSHRCGYHHQF